MYCNSTKFVMPSDRTHSNKKNKSTEELVHSTAWINNYMQARWLSIHSAVAVDPLCCMDLGASTAAVLAFVKVNPCHSNLVVTFCQTQLFQYCCHVLPSTVAVGCCLFFVVDLIVSCYSSDLASSPPSAVNPLGCIIALHPVGKTLGKT